MRRRAAATLAGMVPAGMVPAGMVLAVPAALQSVRSLDDATLEAAYGRAFG